MIAVFAYAPVVCVAQGVESSVRVQQEIRSLEQQRLRAYLQLDSVALDRIISEDYRSIYANGEVVTKSQEMQWIKSAPANSLSTVTATTEDLSVRPYGAIALLTGRLVIKGKITWSQNDFVMSASFRYTATYAKKQSRWQIVASQFTKIEETAEK
jgi:ketosteroid isomerase-like protein